MKPLEVTGVATALRDRTIVRNQKLGALVDRIEKKIQESVVEHSVDCVTIDLEVSETEFKTVVADAYDDAGWHVEIASDTLYLRVPPPI